MNKKKAIAAVIAIVLILAVILVTCAVRQGTEPVTADPAKTTEEPQEEEEPEPEPEPVKEIAEEKPSESEEPEEEEEIEEYYDDYIWDITVIFPGKGKGNEKVSFTNPGFADWGKAYMNQKFEFTRENNTAQMHIMNAAGWIVDNSEEWYQWIYDEGNSGCHYYECKIITPLDADDNSVHGELEITLMTHSNKVYDYTWDITVIFPQDDQNPTVTFVNPGFADWDPAYVNQSFQFTRENNKAQMKIMNAASWIVDNSESWYQWGFDNGGSGYGYSCEVVKPLVDNDKKIHGELIITLNTSGYINGAAAPSYTSSWSAPVYNYIWDIMVVFPELAEGEADPGTEVTFTNPGFADWAEQYRSQSFSFTREHNTAMMNAVNCAGWIVDNTQAWYQWIYNDGGSGYGYVCEVITPLVENNPNAHGVLKITLMNRDDMKPDYEYIWDVTVVFPELAEGETDPGTVVTFTNPGFENWPRLYRNQVLSFTRENNAAQLKTVDPSNWIVDNSQEWYQWKYDDGGSGCSYSIEVVSPLVEKDEATHGKLKIVLDQSGAIKPKYEYTWDITVEFPELLEGETLSEAKAVFTNPGLENWGEQYRNQKLTFTRENPAAQLKTADPSSWIVDNSQEWYQWSFDDCGLGYIPTYTVISPLKEADEATHGKLKITLDRGRIPEYTWDITVIFPEPAEGEEDPGEMVKFSAPWVEGWNEKYRDQEFIFTRENNTAEMIVTNCDDWIVNEFYEWCVWGYDDCGTGYYPEYRIEKSLTDGDKLTHGKLQITLTKEVPAGAEYTWDITVIFPELAEGEEDSGEAVKFTAPWGEGWDEKYCDQHFTFTRENNTAEMIVINCDDWIVTNLYEWCVWGYDDCGSGYIPVYEVIKPLTDGDKLTHGKLQITLTKEVPEGAEYTWDITVIFPELAEGEEDPGEAVKFTAPWGEGWDEKYCDQHFTFTRENNTAEMIVINCDDWIVTNLYEWCVWGYDDCGSGYTPVYEVIKPLTDGDKLTHGQLQITLTKEIPVEPEYTWDITVIFPELAEGEEDSGEAVKFTAPWIVGWDMKYQQSFSFTRENNTAVMIAAGCASEIVDNTQSWFQWGYEDNGEGYTPVYEVIKPLTDGDKLPHGQLQITLTKEVPVEPEYTWDVTVVFPELERWEKDRGYTIAFTSLGFEDWEEKYRARYEFTRDNNTAQMIVMGSDEWMSDITNSYLWKYEDDGSGYTFSCQVDQALVPDDKSAHGKMTITLTKAPEYVWDITVVFPELDEGEENAGYTVTFINPGMEGWAKRYMDLTLKFTHENPTAEMIAITNDDWLVNNTWYPWKYDDGGSGYIPSYQVVSSIPLGDMTTHGKLTITLTKPDGASAAMMNAQNLASENIEQISGGDAGMTTAADQQEVSGGDTLTRVREDSPAQISGGDESFSDTMISLIPNSEGWKEEYMERRFPVPQVLG